MKIRNILTNVLLVSALSISQNTFLLSSNQAKAQESARPYVIFVNGQGNCCADMMDSLSDRLTRLYGLTRNDFRYVPYSNFRNGGKSGGGNDFDWSSVDTQFLNDGSDFINNQLDRNRPLIIIGHSYGGDSTLKLLTRIKEKDSTRRIQFVAVIDPVGTGGFRSVAQESSVPTNVDYFFNRWQENVMFPVDFGRDGSMQCNAKQCDQEAQNIARGEDSTPRTIECSWAEINCPGFVAPNPFIGRKGQKGRKQVRVGHQDLPLDPYIQRILGDKIQQQLADFRPPSQGLSSFKRIENKASGRCLDLQEQNNRNGGFANVYDCVDHPNQAWKINDLGNGYVKIENKASGRCLDLQEQNNRNGGFANVYDCVDHPNQAWKINDLGNGYVKIENKASGRCLDLQEQNNRNGGFANVYDCVNHPNQTWKILDIK
jgi:pimeloyl-ACP methyl ester carboxylesterase